MRHGWTWLTATNTLAYNGTEWITVVKSFIALAFGFCSSQVFPLRGCRIKLKLSPTSSDTSLKGATTFSITIHFITAPIKLTVSLNINSVCYRFAYSFGNLSNSHSLSHPLSLILSLSHSLSLSLILFLSRTNSLSQSL